jgi:hypothetical protein
VTVPDLDPSHTEAEIKQGFEHFKQLIENKKQSTEPVSA